MKIDQSDPFLAEGNSADEAGAGSARPWGFLQKSWKHEIVDFFD